MRGRAKQSAGNQCCCVARAAYVCVTCECWWRGAMYLIDQSLGGLEKRRCYMLLLTVLLFTFVFWTSSISL